MFDPTTLTSATTCSMDTNVACGLTSFSSTALVFEGDVDGSGVSQVYLQLAQNVNGGACVTLPCVLRRGTVLKSVGGTPPYYTELNNVNNKSIFTAYKYDGSAYNAAWAGIMLSMRITKHRNRSVRAVRTSRCGYEYLSYGHHDV